MAYLLDGDHTFLTAVEAARAYARRRDDRGATPALVVGIGYPPGTDLTAARTFDLTPPKKGHALPTGGASAFMDFIERDLKPAIARDYPVNPERQALLGHSLGGRFVLDMMLSRPGAFRDYVAMSSSFWFGGHEILPRIDAFGRQRAADAPPIRLLLTVGEYEETPEPGSWAASARRSSNTLEALARRGQVTHARASAQRLAALPGMLVDFREIAGEDHGTVISAAIGRGLDFVVAGPPAVPPVPSARDYLKLTPDERYRLRMQVRALPSLHRTPWLVQFRAALAGLDDATRARLDEERERMDAEHGSRPHAAHDERH